MSTHDCIKRINALLADRNTEISTAISFADPARELIRIATNKADAAKRGKPVSFFASYCPFCGKSLGGAQEGADREAAG